MNSILDFLEQHARVDGDREFLVLDDERLTFAEMFTRVQRLAGVLRARGVVRGDRVVLYAARRTRYLTAYLAAMAAEAIPIHLYPERPPAFVDFAAAHTGAALVITDQEKEEWASFPHPVLRWPDLDDATLPAVWPRECAEIAYMMFTSGTTGQPKAVMTTQANVLFVTRTLIGMAGMTPDDRELIVMPLGSTGGLGHFHANLLLGRRTILLPFFFGSMTAAEMEQMLETIAAETITGFLATPGMLGQLATQHRESFREKCRNLRYILSNVCPVRPELVRDLIALLPNTRFHTYYGLTEASRSVYQCYNDEPEHVTAAGRPAPGVRIRIDEPNEAGDGEVLIDGGNVMAGYWGRGRDGFDSDGWFRTGDLGNVDAAGFLTIRGRVRDNINVDGLKFVPREVEDVLLAHPAVVDCAVVGLPDPIRFQRPGAMVVLAGNVDRATIGGELDAYCRGRLDFYKVPVRFDFAESIPRSELGKVNRDLLVALMMGAMGT
jgi:acyl-CoA synthetase (AMP-forming)/AMP-acid ligase II